MLTIALLMPFGYLRPAFQSPLASSEGLQGIVPVNSVFGERFRLLGYKVDGVGQAGKPMEIALYWESATAQTTPDDLMTEAQLAPADAQSWVAGDIAYLGTGRYPTSVWQAGDLIVQRHELLPPVDSLTPALYWIGVGLSARPGGERLPVTSGLPAGPGGLVRLGPVRLYPADGAESEPANRTEYQVGPSIALQGYDVDWNVIDRRLNVAFHWEALSVIPDDWTVFVHLVGRDGTFITQDDAPPVRGNFPTSWWQAGDVVVDWHELIVPAGIEPPDLSLYVGLYDSATGARLPVTDAGGKELPNGTISLPVRP
jgi:hypothetical protein